MNTPALSSAARFLLASTLVTNIGNGMYTLTVGKLLYDQTGSAAAFGGVLILEQVVSFLLHAVAGPWVDRGDPRRICVGVDLVRGLFICAASALLGVGNITTWIVLTTLVIQVPRPFYRAANFTLTPAVVPAEALTRFNGQVIVYLQVGQLAGILLAGPIIQHLGSEVCLALNGVSFVLAALAVAFVKVPPSEVPAARSRPGVREAVVQLARDWHEVYVLLRRNTGLLCHLILSAGDYVAVALLNLALVPIVMHRHDGNTYWLSAFDGGYALGSIVGAMLLVPMERTLGPRASVLIGITGQGIALALMGESHHAWLTVGLSFVIGTMNSISASVLLTALQLRLKGPIKGRIASVRNLLTAAVSALMIPIFTHIEARSLSLALAASGVVCFGFTFSFLILGHRRVLDNTLLSEPPAEATASAPKAA
jgi:hypothetical protein